MDAREVVTLHLRIRGVDVKREWASGASITKGVGASLSKCKGAIGI